MAVAHGARTENPAAVGLDSLLVVGTSTGGESQSNPVVDPNPRLEAIAYGCTRWLHTVAAHEGLDVQTRVGNPIGGGIHAKLLLVHVEVETWNALGSLNGGEVSHKLNREVVLLVDHPQLFARLLEFFLYDWEIVMHSLNQ